MDFFNNGIMSDSFTVRKLDKDYEAKCLYDIYLGSNEIRLISGMMAILFHVVERVSTQSKLVSNVCNKKFYGSFQFYFIYL